MDKIILDSIWFGVIGIVAVDSNGHGWKCYIGSSMGEDEKTDCQRIATNGMPIGQAIALAAFPNLEQKEFKN